jgi:hypothetical protein
MGARQVKIDEIARSQIYAPFIHDKSGASAKYIMNLGQRMIRIPEARLAPRLQGHLHQRKLAIELRWQQQACAGPIPFHYHPALGFRPAHHDGLGSRFIQPQKIAHRGVESLADPLEALYRGRYPPLLDHGEKACRTARVRRKNSQGHAARLTPLFDRAAEVGVVRAPRIWDLQTRRGHGSVLKRLASIRTRSESIGALPSPQRHGATISRMKSPLMGNKFMVYCQ